jgi:hypothetical protein
MSVRNGWIGPVLLLLLSACGRRSAGDMEGLLTPLTVEPPPIYAIIGARADLMLTSEQVARLDSIAVAVQAVNRPLIEDLEEVSPPARTGARRLTDAGEPILEQIRANTRQASEQVHGLLTEGQREEVCELFNRRPGRAGPGAPPRQAPADSVATGRFGMGPRWYWCAPSNDGGGAISYQLSAISYQSLVT